MENEIKIPSSFQILGQTIKVKNLKTLWKKEKAWGTWDEVGNTIKLQKPAPELPFTKEQIEQTFIHEFVHATLDILSYDKLGEDEKFVDGMAHAIHQMLKTSKYD